MEMNCTPYHPHDNSSYQTTATALSGARRSLSVPLHVPTQRKLPRLTSQQPLLFFSGRPATSAPGKWGCAEPAKTPMKASMGTVSRVLSCLPVFPSARRTPRALLPVMGVRFCELAADGCDSSSFFARCSRPERARMASRQPAYGMRSDVRHNFSKIDGRSWWQRLLLSAQGIICLLVGDDG